jgi:hypothetical protein
MQIGTYLNSNSAMKSVCVILFNYLVIASQEMVCIPKPTSWYWNFKRVAKIQILGTR